MLGKELGQLLNSLGFLWSGSGRGNPTSGFPSLSCYLQKVILGYVRILRDPRYRDLERRQVQTLLRLHCSALSTGWVRRRWWCGWTKVQVQNEGHLFGPGRTIAVKTEFPKGISERGNQSASQRALVEGSVLLSLAELTRSVEA